MKRCSKCGEKEESKFYWHHPTICRSCLRRYGREHYQRKKKEAFKERILEEMVTHD